MTDHEFNQKIRTAMEHAAPDQLDSILSSCDELQNTAEASLLGEEQEKGDIIQMKEKTNHRLGRGWMAVVAAAVVVLLLGAAGLFGRKNVIYPVDSVVILDVNPSILLAVDVNEKVLSAEALNDDAREVLGDMELKNTPLDVALNAIIGSMLQKGYLGDLQNSILVTVENADAARSEALQKKVAETIENAVHSDTLDAAILSQSVDGDDDVLKELAEQYGISMGKAALIQEVISQDSTLTFESLAPLTINEIALIASSKNLTGSTVSQSGYASQKAYIGQEEALNRALEHAQVSMSELIKCDAEFDSEDGVMVYEIEFETAEKKCEYDIEARTGEILKFEIKDKTGTSSSGKEAVNPSVSNDTAADKTSVNRETEAEADVTKGTEENTGSGPTAGGKIGEAAAKEIALAHAGVEERNTYYAVCYLAYDKGREDHYEVKFMTGTTAYQYGIDLYTGEVLHHKEENHHGDHGYYDYHGHYDYHGGHTAASEEADISGSYIGEDTAWAVALAHAGVEESVTLKKKVKLDEQKGRMVYEVEFEVGKSEYEYLIDAVSGEIIDVEFDIDD